MAKRVHFEYHFTDQSNPKPLFCEAGSQQFVCLKQIEVTVKLTGDEFTLVTLDMRGSQQD